MGPVWEVVSLTGAAFVAFVGRFWFLWIVTPLCFTVILARVDFLGSGLMRLRLKGSEKRSVLI